MKLAVLHVNSAAAHATSPTMRIARFTAQHLGVPLIHDVASAERYRNVKFDVLLVKYGVLKFSNHREDALTIYGNARRIVNLENDYSFKRDARFKRLHPEDDLYWSTVPANGKYVNWNVLTWLWPRQWNEGVLVAPAPAKPRVLYYGAFRADRIGSFNRFLGPNAKYPVTFGARSTHVKKFQALNPTAEVLNFRDPTQLQGVGPALYLEDTTTHTLYCSLANRFYECLQLGIPQLLDAAGENTYKTAKLKDYTEFAVAEPSDVSRMLKATSYAKMRDHQQKLWYKDFDEALRKQLDAARIAL